MKNIITALIVCLLLFFVSSCSSAPKTLNAFYNKYKTEDNTNELNINGFFVKMAALKLSPLMVGLSKEDGSDLRALKPFVNKIRGLKIMSIQLNSAKASEAKKDLNNLMQQENFDELISVNKNKSLTKIAIIKHNSNKNEFVIANIMDNKINIINFKSTLSDENISALISEISKEENTTKNAL